MYQKPHGGGGGGDGGGGQFQGLTGLTKQFIQIYWKISADYNELEEILLDVEINFIPLQTTIQMNGQKDKDMYNDVKTTRGKDGNMNTRNRQTRQN